MSNQLVAEATAYATHNKHNRRTSTSSAGFEPTILEIERPQKKLDGTATGIGYCGFTFVVTSMKAYIYMFIFSIGIFFMPIGYVQEEASK
jgi:hypothetical protein